MTRPRITFADGQCLIRCGTYGLTFHPRYFRPRADRCRGPYGSCYWFVDGLGVSLWRDTFPPLTVGGLGVW
jgi:hypothetical protein